jgi:hypothetical protein
VELRIDSAPWRRRTRIYGAVTRSIRILLAEGDAPTRAGLRLSVAGADLQVVAEAGGGSAICGLRSRIIVLGSDPSGEELLAAVPAGAW